MTKRRTARFLFGALLALGLASCNEIDIGGTVPGNGVTLVANATPSGTFNGWTLVKAVGPTTPAAQGSDLGTLSASVALSWSAITVAGASASSYNIYRATSAGTQTFASPLATGLASASYTDGAVIAGTTYYYTVLPVTASGVVQVTSGADNEIKIIVPQANMVLVHRWAANKEMCELMGKTVDRTQNYRCAVSTGAAAPPGTAGSGFFDLGSSLFVDAVEQGCNYTYSSTLAKCGSANGCIGIAADPNATVTGNQNDVYYSRRTGTCYINSSAGAGTTWTTAESASAAQRALMASVSPGLPPFINISQPHSQDACNGQTVSGAAGVKRLLRRKEQFLASAWAPTTDDATINVIENGVNLDTTFNCNTNLASPQGSAVTDITAAHPTIGFDDLAVPAAKDTLPGCRHGNCAATGYAVRNLRTGSNSTKNCVSRYGAQDMVGNVWEWTSDQVSCDGAQCVGIAAAANSVDTGNDDFHNITFDGTQGPVAGGTFTSSALTQFPLSVPIVSAGYSRDGLVALTSTQLHGDSMYIDVSVGTRGFFNGGGTGSGSNAGRYALNLFVAPTYTSTSTGFRCVISAD